MNLTCSSCCLRAQNSILLACVFTQCGFICIKGDIHSGNNKKKLLFHHTHSQCNAGILKL